MIVVQLNVFEELFNGIIFLQYNKMAWISKIKALNVVSFEIRSGIKISMVWVNNNIAWIHNAEQAVDVLTCENLKQEFCGCCKSLSNFRRNSLWNRSSVELKNKTAFKGVRARVSLNADQFLIMVIWYKVLLLKSFS